MPIKKFTFILLLIVIGYSCKKEPKDPNVVDGIDLTQLPPATMTGANTMGCLINGEVWLPLKKNPLGILDYDISFNVTALSQGGGISIQARQKIKSTNNEQVINFVASDVIETGVYLYPDWASGHIFWGIDGCGFFDVDTVYSNEIQITRLDYDEEIVSGLFHFLAISTECDTIEITEGRFDLSNF